MKKTSVGTGLGCLSIAPAAFIGLVGLTDGLGPTGWRGCAEIVGWIAVCVAINFGLTLLFTPAGWSKCWRYAVGFLAIGGFTLMTNWLGLGAPMDAKIAFTSTLQVVGSISVIGAALTISYFVVTARR